MATGEAAKHFFFQAPPYGHATICCRAGAGHSAARLVLLLMLLLAMLLLALLLPAPAARAGETARK
jgi:hypothetical protein